jgi:hypothetical protein
MYPYLKILHSGGDNVHIVSRNCTTYIMTNSSYKTIKIYCDMMPESQSKMSTARQWHGNHVSVKTNSSEYIAA